MKKLKIENLNIKRFALLILALLLAIVAGLTVSSRKINEDAGKQTMSVNASTKAILKTEDESFEETLKENKTGYIKLGNDTYVVDYGSAGDVEKAIYETYKDNDSVMANEDTIFTAMAGENDEAESSDIAPVSDVLPDGMTWREYADSVGKKLVAVIDTGVSSDYSSLQKNFTDEADEDENGHGTAVAKTILANANDKAIVLSLKAMGKDGTGYMSDVMAAVQYAREQHVDIINMSIAAPDNGSNSIFKQQITDTIAEGIQIVAAAGNYNSSAMTYIPANIEGVISVGAMDANNKKIESSNYAATYYEKADSTSQAAAVLTGKLAGSTDISNETTDENVKYDKTDITPSLFSPCEKTIEEEKDGKKRIYQAFDTNYSDDTVLFLKSHGSEYYVAADGDISEFFPDGIKFYTQYDKVYGTYFYAFDDSDSCKKAYDSVEGKTKNQILYSVLPEENKNFSVQENGSWVNCPRHGSIHQWALYLDVSQSGDTTSWTLGVSAWSSTGTFATDFGSGTYDVDIGGSHWGTAGFSIRKFGILNSSYPTSVELAKNSCTGKYDTIGISASVTFNSSYKNDFSGTSTLSSTFNTNRTREVTYKVSFNSNGGSNHPGAISRTVAPNTNYTIDLPSPGSKTGYNFAGWYEGGTNVGSRQWTTTGNHTLTAHWTAKTYKLTLDPAGGAINGNSNSQVLNPDLVYDGGNWWTVKDYLPERTGWTFTGYYDAKTGGNKVYDVNGNCVEAYFKNKVYKHDGNLTVYAQWSENHYKVQYNANDNGMQQTSTTATGSTPSKANIGYTQTINIEKNGFSKQGYHFVHWNTKPDDTGKTYTEGEEVKGLVAKDNGSITLYAIWARNTYTIHFDANGGQHVRAGVSEVPTSETDQYATTAGMEDQSQTYDAAKPLTSNTFKWDGHTFLGWSTDKTATSATYRDGVKPGRAKNQAVADTTEKGIVDGSENNDKVTLYAIWRADAYTVTIDPVRGSGTWNGSSSVRKGEDDVHKDGAGNTRWGDKVILGDAVAVDKSVTVTYDKNADDAVIDRESDTVKLVFSRWSQNKGAKGLFFNNSARANDGSHDDGATTYYIVQNSNDTVTAQYYFQTVTLPTPTREGYTFLGWYEDEALTKKADRGGTGNGGSLYRTEQDIKLFARWQKNEFNYADTEQVFMQDQSSDTTIHDFEAWIRKADAVTQETFVGTPDNQAVIEVYKDSVAPKNLVFTYKTAEGVFRPDGSKNNRVTLQNGWWAISKGFDLEKNGKYIMHEVTSPAGYTKSPDVEFTTKQNSKNQMQMEDQPFYLSARKVDQDGNPVNGAEFRLDDTTAGTVVGSYTSAHSDEAKEDGVIFYRLNTLIAGHSYRLTETKAPDGWELASPVTFKAPEYNGETLDDIVVVDKQNLVNLKVKKVDSKNTVLEGAVFQLFTKDINGDYQSCYMNEAGDLVSKDTPGAAQMIETSGADGIATFKNLPRRASFTGSEPDFTKSYYLKEIQAPDGHALMPDYMEIRFPDDNEKTYTYTVTDESVTLTLEAGGSGIQMYALIGTGIIALALILKKFKSKHIYAE